MFQTLRSKLFATFLGFTIALGLLVFIDQVFSSRQSHSVALHSRVESMRADYIEENVAMSDFILQDLRNMSYFPSRQSANLDRRDSLLKVIELTTEWLGNEDFVLKNGFAEPLREARAILVEYKAITDSIIDNATIRGFQDEGLEGQMREYAHRLEERSTAYIAREHLLSLRRREKDYILRGLIKYHQRFNEEVDVLLARCKEHDDGTAGCREAVADLTKYRDIFNQYVGLNQRLGLVNNTGLTAHANAVNKRMLRQLDDLVTACADATAAFQARERTIWMVAVLFMFAMSLVFTVLLSRSLTKQLAALSLSINRFVKSRFTDEADDMPKELARDETGRLIQNFRILKQELSSLVENLNVEKKRAEAASEAKSMFLANMSHEIRTPLNGVLGMTQIMQNMNPDKAQRDCLDIISFSGENLLRLINDILDYSKIEAGKLELENTAFDLKDSVRKVIALLRTKAQSKGLYLELEIDDRLPDEVMGDSLRIQQVLINLINNAVKFTEQGGVHMNISAEETTDSGVSIAFSISDTGIGMDREQLSSLFEAFRQADSSTTRKYGGTGLGLAISSSLVEMMGGSLRAQSVPGKGSTFSFLIDVEVASTASFDAVDDHFSGGQANRKGLRILLAEDNEINQTVIRLMLENHGHAVLVAKNGEEAVDMWQSTEADLVLMDIQMPIKNGYQATADIIAHPQYAFRQTPIVALTANAFKEDRENARKAGMVDFLSKPVNQSELKRVLDRFSQVQKSHAV